MEEIELNFKQAGFKISWANEFDKNACTTYKLNFSKHKLIEDDIWNLISNDFKDNNEPLDKIDVLVAGFLSKSFFQLLDIKRGFDDPRGNLFFAIKEFIVKFKPKAILLENVKNLQTHDNGTTFRVISKELDNLGYSITSKVLNSSDYTNIPQNRERIFIVGFKKDLNLIGLFVFLKKLKILNQIRQI